MIIMAMAFLFSASCSQGDHKNLLNGKWHNDLMDVEYDFNKGTTTAKFFGNVENKKLEYVKNTDKGAIIKSGDSTIFVTIKDDRHISIVKEGSGISLDMEKVSD